MKHTSRPWAVYTDHPAEPGIRYVRTSPQIYSGEVAVIYPNDHAEADARLIAAAPDLLALAKQYASECTGCAGEGSWIQITDIAGPATREPCADCADIRAVIDKAERQS